MIIICIIKTRVILHLKHTIVTLLFLQTQHTEQFNINKFSAGSSGRSKAMSGSDHLPLQTAFHGVTTISGHLLSLSSWSPLNTSHVKTIRPGLAWSTALLQGAAPECLGCGVMMYISANGVQFTLGGKCKHVHVTL